MTETCGWGRTLNFELDELTVNHFAINYDWLEVSQLVLELSFLVFASKEVDTLEDCVRLLSKEQIIRPKLSKITRN